MSDTSSPRTWLITGASRGIGRALTIAALERGDQVIATLRNLAMLDDLPISLRERLLCLEQDVRDPGRAAEVVDLGVDQFGVIDVLVNNAGYGLVGAIEELSEESIRQQFETNFLGAVWTTQSVLPHMRANGIGDLVQISTTGAVGTMPFFGMYNASKWALEGYSEALAREIQGLGIGMTIAELGGFDTDWARSSMVFESGIAAYDDFRLSLFGQKRLPWDLETEDPDAGDPAEAASAVIDHLDQPREDRPLRLLVGDDAPDQVSAALAMRRDDYARNPGFQWPS